MINAVSEVLKLRLSSLKTDGIVTSLHGISKVAYTSFLSKDPKKLDSIPVPYDIDSTDSCFKDDTLSLIPKEKGIRSIIYFESSQQSRFIDIDESEKPSTLSTNLKLVCWYNEEYFNSNQDVNSLLISIVSQKILSSNIKSSQYIDYLKVTDLSVSTIEDSMGVFHKYTYLIEKENILLKPYGFFTLDIGVNYSIKQCNTNDILFDSPMRNC